jgi:hypothetical protein
MTARKRDGLFETQDLYAAAALMDSGHQLIDLRGRDSRSAFVFKDGPDLAADLRAFYMGPLHRYAERVRSCKSMVKNAPSIERTR